MSHERYTPEQRTHNAFRNREWQKFSGREYRPKVTESSLTPVIDHKGQVIGYDGTFDARPLERSSFDESYPDTIFPLEIAEGYQGE